MLLTADTLPESQKNWTLEDYKVQVKTTLDAYLATKQESVWTSQVKIFLENLNSYNTYAELYTNLVELKNNCRSSLSSWTLGYLGSNQLYTVIDTLLSQKMPCIALFESLLADRISCSPPASPLAHQVLPVSLPALPLTFQVPAIFQRAQLFYPFVPLSLLSLMHKPNTTDHKTNPAISPGS